MTWKPSRVAPDSIVYDEDTHEHFLQDTSGYHEYQSIVWEERVSELRHGFFQVPLGHACMSRGR